MNVDLQFVTIYCDSNVLRFAEVQLIINHHVS